MPRRHVSTITGYKVVISCFPAGDRWQQKSPHKGGKSRQNGRKSAANWKCAPACSFWDHALGKKVVSLEKKPFQCVRHYIFLSFYGQMSISSARLFGVPSSRVSLITSLIIWEFWCSAHRFVPLYRCVTTIMTWHSGFALFSSCMSLVKLIIIFSNPVS